MKVIKAKKITKKNFSKFGQLIDTSKKNPININDGYAKRFDNLINVDASKNKGKAIVSIFKAEKMLIVVSPLSLEVFKLAIPSYLFAYPSLIFIGCFLDVFINCPNLENFFLVIFFAFTIFILQNFQTP